MMHRAAGSLEYFKVKLKMYLQKDQICKKTTLILSVAIYDRWQKNVQIPKYALKKTSSIKKTKFVKRTMIKGPKFV